MLKPRNLFFLLAALGGILALTFRFLVASSADMPQRSHLAYAFGSIAGVMTVIGLIYWIMEKLKRPVAGKIGMSHYCLTLVAVVCGIICTSTAHDGIENSTWTSVPSFLSVKLFIVSVGVFLFGVIRALVMRRPEIK